MSEGPSLMELVNEIHRLRNENLVLREQMQAQAVQLDAVLEKGGKVAWRRVQVQVPLERVRLATKGEVLDALTQQMVGEVMQQTLYTTRRPAEPSALSFTGYVAVMP